jgi:hypothetical protein
MDRIVGGGIAWREQITPLLHERGIIVLDPTKKPLPSAQDETSREERLAWIEAGRYDKVAAFMREVRGQDLRMVNIADFLIIRIDPSVHMCGSYEEVAIANHEKKPILVWTYGGKEHTPWWIFGQVPEEMIFGSLDDLLGYLDFVDSAPHVDTHRRWFFFDQTKLYHPEIIRRLAMLSPEPECSIPWTRENHDTS